MWIHLYVFDDKEPLCPYDHPYPTLPPVVDYQMILFDTPGIIETKRNKLEERMMSAVISSIQVCVIGA